jgi:Pyruvate/2-oxoacid:ferredoxin oxidoreductase delta subunit
MPEDIFRELQQQLDTYSLGFPATESGIELQILKELFSVEDAALFLELTLKLEPAESVAERVNRLVDEVAAQLEDMSQRGLLFRLERGALVKYAAIPFVHGLFEFQVSRLGPKFARMMEQYLDEKFHANMSESAEMFLRTVPIQRSIEAANVVAAYEDACELLKTKEKIVITECICRKQKRLIGEGCDKPLEACFMFGSMGQYYLDHGMGRRIDVEEAIQILTEAQEAGLVTQPGTSQNPGGMCTCCGDCCGVLTSLNRHPKPAEIVFSNHYAAVDQEACVGCEACLDRCQMGALTMNEKSVVQINLDRCIGCGLCVTSCPEEAMRLVPKPDNERRTPPASAREQMMLMAQKRGIPF